jgi:hypothetical protein
MRGKTRQLRRQRFKPPPPHENRAQQSLAAHCVACADRRKISTASLPRYSND